MKTSRQSVTRKIRILLVGPLPPPMGGNTRHFATLVADLKEHPGFEVTVVNTSRGRWHSNPIRNVVLVCKTLFSIALKLRNNDIVSYHASDRGMFLFGPVVVLLGKLARTPSILRMFGGSFWDYYKRKTLLQKWIIRKFILSATVVLLQTHRLVNEIQLHATGKVVWFSTYVTVSENAAAVAAQRTREAKGRCTRFVFLGHVSRKKGIDTILDSAPSLPEGCSIDIYGPLDEYSRADLRERGLDRVRYRGFLSHSEVDDRLWSYDCLVLPTYYPGEGYPGVIAEAYAHGLPVITTNWMAIPEIVGDDSGIIIEPRDAKALVGAIESMFRDKARWVKLKEGARSRAREFDHAVWSTRFETICSELIERSMR